MNKPKTRIERYQQKKKQQRTKNTKIATVSAIALTTLPLGLGAFSQNAEAAQVTSSQQAFINQIAGTASSIAASNDLYASVVIAQAVLESGYGTSGLASAPNYNLFGVKEYNGGPAVYYSTKEYLNGQWVTISQPFRKYSSYWESLQDHANVLLSSRYAGARRSHTNSYYDATAYLTGRYATDPSYAAKLNSIINTYALYQYDSGSTGQTASTSYSSSSTTTSATTSTTTSTSTSTYSSATSKYTVKSGDTLSEIAQKYGTTVSSLMANNGLSSDLILVGQTLTV